MNSSRCKRLTLLSSLALLLALSGCNRSGNGDSGRRADSGIGGSRAAQAVAARDAQGSGTGGAAADTGTMGASGPEKVDDAAITAQVSTRLAREKELGTSKIDVDTRNGVVTLSGPTPSASAKERAAEIAHRVRGVESVNNQLTITSS